MSEFSFDVVIVGSGTSAYYCAHRLVDGGKKVAMIDERPYGGTCALRGCQPKKYLVANAEAVAAASHLVGNGIVSAPRTDWKALQRLKGEFLNGLSAESRSGYEESGIRTFDGHATLIGPDRLQVGDDILKAEHIVIATGSLPRRCSIPGCEYAGTSDEFLNLPDLPSRVVFVGGGYISFEFATVTAHAGSRATILHRSANVLKHFERDCVGTLLKAASHTGIEVVTNETPVRIEKTTRGLLVHGESGNRYEADVVIEATGREPNLGVLGGQDHGVEHSPKGVTVNDHLQSVSNPQVYAIGDVSSSGQQLATVGDYQGELAAINILEGNTRKVDYRVVPSAVFTIPTLATVGYDEPGAKAAGLDYRVNCGDTAEWASSKRIGEQQGYYKVLIENGSDRILGAHLVRHNAAEVINIFALAIRQNLTSHDLKSVMWAYPTASSDLKKMV